MFPGLVQIADGKAKFLINFFRYKKLSPILQGLGGGSGEFNNFLGNYRERIEKFKNGAKHPVIMIVDSDQGSDDLFTHLGRILKKKITVPDPFYWVYENLYVVPISARMARRRQRSRIFLKNMWWKPN